MEQLELFVPTYNGNRFPDEVEADRMQEYGEPHLPILAYRQDGLRVVLGTHEPDIDTEKPDLLIERQPNAWAIFLHPDGSDPTAYLYVLDDAQSFLVGENWLSATPPLQIVESSHEIPGIHDKAHALAYFDNPHHHGPRTSRLLPRKLRDLGVIGAAIGTAILEICRIAQHEKLEPLVLERIINKHLLRLSRPQPPSA